MSNLDHITIRGFRSIRDAKKLELRPVNIVIGANGAGKSNFIETFDFLRSIREGRLQEYVIKNGGADKLLFFGAKETQVLVVKISFDEEQNQYEIKMTSDSRDRLIPVAEAGFFWDKARYDRPYKAEIDIQGEEAGISGKQKAKTVGHHVSEQLKLWRRYHFHDTGANSPMKKTASLHDNRYLRSDGSNIAAFLYLLKSKHIESYSLIRKAVQRVAPFFDDFELEPMALNKEKIQLVWKHQRSEEFFDASALSDGTLRFVGLATLFLQPEVFRPSVILVDEPELGLHPYAIGLLASLLKQVSHETQVIAATQSPVLLDYFEPDDVIVSDQIQGETRFRRLELDELRLWLEEYSLGQLWEKNQLGARP